MSPRHLSRQIVWSALGVALLLPSVVLSNPLPAAMVFTHVQEVNPLFCEQCPIEYCDQIQQYATLTGPVEFDLFVFTGGYVAVHDLALNLQWPVEWTLVDWAVCQEGEGILEAQDNQADFALTWPQCPEFPTEVFLAARLVFNVTGFGTLQVRDGTPGIYIGCPPDGFWDWPMCSGGQAGVECSYCYASCDLSLVCRPNLTPGVLDLEAEQGTLIEEHLDVEFNGEFCTGSYSATEPWIYLDVSFLGPGQDELTVTIDTNTLAPGEYYAWIRGESHCVGCTRVLLNVLPAMQSVPEDPCLPPSRDAETWGRVKALYR